MACGGSPSDQPQLSGLPLAAAPLQGFWAVANWLELVSQGMLNGTLIQPRSWRRLNDRITRKRSCCRWGCWPWRSALRRQCWWALNPARTSTLWAVERANRHGACSAYLCCGLFGLTACLRLDAACSGIPLSAIVPEAEGV